MPQAPWERQEAAAPRARAPEPSGLLAPERGSKSDISSSIASAFNGRNPPAETLIKPRPQSAKGVFSPPRDNLSIGALVPLGATRDADLERRSPHATGSSSHRGSRTACAPQDSMLGPSVRSGRPDHLPPAEPGLRSEAVRSAHAGNRPNEKPPVTVAEQRFAEMAMGAGELGYRPGKRATPAPFGGRGWKPKRGQLQKELDATEATGCVLGL